MKIHLGKPKVMVVSLAGEGCSVTTHGGKIEEVQSKISWVKYQC